MIVNTKKCTNYQWLTFPKKGREKLIEDKVTKIQLNKRKRMERTDQFYDKLNASISENNFDLKKMCDSIVSCVGLYNCDLATIDI